MPPLPLVEKGFLDCCFDETPQLDTWEVECCDTPPLFAT
jgi:hypothetical protein